MTVFLSCCADAYVTLTLVDFVVREADKPYHRVLSGQEWVQWLDPEFQKCWRPHPQPSSPCLWHHLHSNTETGERSLPSQTWCWISILCVNAMRYSLSPPLFSGSRVWQVEWQQPWSYRPTKAVPGQTQIPWAPAAKCCWQPCFPWLCWASLCKCLS